MTDMPIVDVPLYNLARFDFVSIRLAVAYVRTGVVRHVHVCAGTAAITQFLPSLLAEYAELRPEVQIDLEEQVSEQVVTTVREGRVDLGVYVAGP